MIAIVDVSIQAANPSMPLYPWRAYLNSPSSLRIRNVPRRIGNWNIDKVYVTAAYPDNAIKSAQCVLVGGIWVCTIEGSTVSGLSQNGYTIYADGKDENGNEVTGYVLGKGDITILESDGTITPDEPSYYVHMLSAEPTAPKEGDLWQTEGSWFIYQDGTSYPIGDDSGLIRQLSNELSNYELTANMYSDVSSIVLSTETTESWDYQIPQSVVELGYTIKSLEYNENIQQWQLELTIVDESWTWYSSNQQTDTNLTFDEGNAANEFGIIYASWNTTNRNVLGLAMESELSSYELTANMQNDVSAIVLHKTPVEPAQWIWPQMVRAAGNDTYYQESYAHQADWDKTKCYYVPFEVEFDNQYKLWNVLAYAYQWEEYSESWEEFARVDDSVEAPYDALTLTVTDIDEEFDTFTLQRVAQNTLGFAMMSDLSSKQDKLSDSQISAIDSVVDERATIFDFGNGDISALNLVGEITVQELIDAGIHAQDDTWIKDPVSVKLGTAVTGIDEYTFFTAMYMTNITFPNSVTHIDDCAFQECHALSSITIPESVESVGAYAFDACYNLTSIIVKGKTQAEAETMFAGARVSPSIITTWNDASQEWVKEQNYISSVPSTYKTYQETVNSLSNDGYATTTYAVHNLSGVANITSMPLSSYEAISATADTETLYVITED